MGRQSANVRSTIRMWWTRIRHAGAVERPREWADAQAWAEGAIQGVRVDQTRVREQFAETESAWFAGRKPDTSRVPREEYYHSQAARWCAVGGWCLTVLEAIFAGGLAILLLTLPLVLAVAIGIVVTALLALGLKGWVSAKVARYQERPKEGRDWALRLLTWTAPAAALALAVLFLIRGLAGAWVAIAFPIATALAALVTPVIAGALLTLAALYRWSKDLTVIYRDLEQSERELVELRDAAVRGLSASPGAITTSKPLPTQLARTGGVLFLTLVLCSNLACNGVQAASPSTSGEKQVSSSGTAEVWIDETGSVDRRDFPQAYEAVLAALLNASTRGNINRWLFYGFGDEPWREQPFFELTLSNWQPPNCEPASEASKVFKMQQAGQAAQCEAQQKKARLVYEQYLQDQMATVRVALEAHRPKPAHCTGLADLLERITQAPNSRAVAVIGDGVETCRATGLVSVPAPVPGTKVSWILIGSAPTSDNGPTLGEQFMRRREKLLRAAPWLRIVAPWQVTSELFAIGG
jgi:hypothetical protein